MTRKTHITLFAACTFFSLSVVGSSPKHEFRAVWVSTAWGLDFPIVSHTNGQKANIRTMLDNLKSAGFNAVIFQVRPGCDALYDSNYEPWSHELNGSGIPPSPYYDPLEYFITQAHARQMELHAWFNPYRVSTIGNANLSSLHSSHVYHQHPDWLLTTNSRSDDNSGMYSNTLLSARDGERESIILDPGKQAVRDHVTNVFLDVVNRYDVDGIHIDDYFYPYGGMAGEDAATFAQEPRGFSDINNWRRDNVNLLIEAVYDSIQAVKPWIKFGASPFGIWQNGVPPGIVGTSSYHDLYCDPLAWLDAGTIDYLTPQLYWPHGGGQDYATLMPWWASTTTEADRHLYVGHSPYRISSWHNWPAHEVPNQIRLNRVTEGSLGSVYFRYRSGIVNNPKGFLDSLRNELYQHIALPPPMDWKDVLPPNAPLNVTLTTEGNHTISWNKPGIAADGDTVSAYVVYRSPVFPVDIGSSANILAVLSALDTTYTDDSTEPLFYAVSSLDRLNTESLPVAAQPPAGIDHTQFSPSGIQLSQNYPNPFNAYTIIRYQLSKSARFTINIYDVNGQQVKTLTSTTQHPGQYEIAWSGKTDDGNIVSSGVYFARLESPGISQVIKMVYLQ